MEQETEQDDWQRLDAGMLSLWHLGIIALPGVGSGRGDGIRACRKVYDEVGGSESGYLGFCFYRSTDADVAARTGKLELVCGDFLNKNLVTRKVQDVVRASLRAAGFDAVSQRGSSHKILLRSFHVGKDRPSPPSPPLDIRPQPPDELVAATTAVPAPSASRPRSRVSMARMMPEDPLEKAKRMVLGLGAPPPIPDVPERTGLTRGTPGVKRRRPTEVPPSVMRAVGIGLILGGLGLTAAFWGTSRTWIGGVVLFVLGSLVFALGCREKPR